MRYWSLVCYDVRDDKRLRRVAKVLEGYGERLQYSVFRCRLSGRERERLRWELAKVMGKEDDLLLVPLCQGCVGRLTDRARRETWQAEVSAHEII